MLLSWVCCDDSRWAAACARREGPVRDAARDRLPVAERHAYARGRYGGLGHGVLPAVLAVAPAEEAGLVGAENCHGTILYIQLFVFQRGKSCVPEGQIPTRGETVSTNPGA